MPDDFTSPPPPDEPTSWLARYRKIAILGGIVIVLGIAVVVTAMIPRKSSKNSTTTVVANQTMNTTAPTNSYNRPTFQRSTVPDVPTTIPPAYRPPTNADLRQAIDQLKK